MTGLECIALTLFLEANTEPLHGKQAVASVIWNRAESEIWPDEPCAVVKQKRQFHFLPKSETNPHYKKQKPALMKVAEQARVYRTTSATYFMKQNAACFNPQASQCKARINRKLKFVTRIGKHLFYE